MPVVRSGEKRRDKKAVKRSLLDRLVKEWSGEGTHNGPVIFETRTSSSDGIDAIVVWNDWETLPLKDRTDIIHDAYEKVQEDAPASPGRKGRSRPKTPMMAFGATVAEAIRNGLLPYSVQETHDGLKPLDAEMLKRIREAKLKHGAIPLSNGEFALAFPRREMASRVLKALRKELPTANWWFDYEDD